MSNPIDRRSFLMATTAAALQAAGEPKRIAAVVTEYRTNSHADVIVGKYLEGYRQGSLNAGLRPSKVTETRNPTATTTTQPTTLNHK